MKKIILLLFIFTSNPILAENLTRTVPFDAKDCNSTCRAEIYDYAKISQGVYKKIDLIEWNGWQRVFVDENVKTGYRAAAYKNEAKRKLVIAFSGTDDLADRVTDLDQFLGTIPEQYEQGINTVQQLLALVSNGVVVPEIGQLLSFDVVLTGHSLGGGIAQFVADIFQQKAVGFNTAPLSSGVLKNIPALREQAKIDYPALVGSASDILHIVTKTQSGIYDFVADSPGTLLGQSLFLKIASEVQDADPVNFSLHAINTVNLELEHFLALPDVEVKLVWNAKNTNLDLVLESDNAENCHINNKKTDWGCRYQKGDTGVSDKKDYIEQQVVNLDVINLHRALYSIKVIDRSKNSQNIDIPISLSFYSHGEAFANWQEVIKPGEEKIVWQSQLGIEN